jgi:excisionase family DNA binding protein
VTTIDQQDALEGWITTAQAAKLLGLTARRVLQLIEEGELVGFKVNPRLWMVKEVSVQAYLKKK